jgi:hypothetical protein
MLHFAKEGSHQESVSAAGRMRAAAYIQGEASNIVDFEPEFAELLTSTRSDLGASPFLANEFFVKAVLEVGDRVQDNLYHRGALLLMLVAFDDETHESHADSISIYESLCFMKYGPVKTKEIQRRCLFCMSDPAAKKPAIIKRKREKSSSNGEKDSRKILREEEEGEEDV